MPLQRWMSEHGHPGWYSWLVVIGGSLVASLTAIAISVTLNARAIERERRAERAAAERQAQEDQAARAASCLVMLTMTEVYTDPPPATPTGRKAAAAWKDLGRIFECQGT